MFIKLEWIPPIVRRRYAEAWDGCDRQRIGEHQERAAKAALKPHTGAVSPSVRRLFMGGSSYFRGGEK
jgi:hypothetical protein